MSRGCLVITDQLSFEYPAVEIMNIMPDSGRSIPADLLQQIPKSNWAAVYFKYAAD
ncbi:MAG: hypothetical protein IPI77_23495 [Saprospiraceae bacterium]|nr:hypothetical protein [Saprospiraceae bacterium]